MFKAIPYRCRFGHVTIKKYYEDSTKGIILCEECQKFIGEYRTKGRKSYYEEGYIKGKEMAVRI